METDKSEGMNLFRTRLGRKVLFASLYVSEGAPIGFIWLALPTRLRANDVPIEQITWLSAVLVLPWTFKFVWAPLVDLLQSSRWTLRHWIVAAQSAMGVTLVPLFWIEPRQQFVPLAVFLLIHAFAAATQDVAIDALCITSTQPGERGQYNGWMQTGMLLGRASMGGGALVLSSYFGERAVIGLLILLTTFPMLLVMMSHPPDSLDKHGDRTGRLNTILASIRIAVCDRSSWFGMLFAIIGGAAFKSLEVIYGPFLVDRGMVPENIGWFSLGPMIFAMICGALVGGRLADRLGAIRCTAIALPAIAVSISTEPRSRHAMGQRHPEIMKLNQWLEKLRQEEKLLVDKAGAGERLADVRREAEEIEAKPGYLSQQPRHHQAPPNEDIARRLEHMRIAVDHLNQAGLHEVAEHVAQRAEVTERELHGHQKHKGGDVMHEIMKQLDELRHEVGRLRNEVSELREKR